VGRVGKERLSEADLRGVGHGKYFVAHGVHDGQWKPEKQKVR